MPMLTVIIVNYNVRFFVEQCLHSLYRAASGVSMEVIIVDNQSTDGSAAYIKKLFPAVKWIQNPKNMGFGAANNIGIKLAEGQYTLLLNPDTLIPENTLHACLQYVTENNIEAIGIRMIDGCGSFLPESKRAFPAPLAAFFKLSGLASVFPRSAFFNQYALGHLHPEANHAVEVLAGAFILVKTATLTAINGFDEKFFMYGEDVDLSYRLQQYGGRPNAYFGTHPIIHFKGESTNRASMGYLRHFYGAMNLFVQKHYSKSGRQTGALLLRLAIYLRAALAAVFMPLASVGSRQSNFKAIIVASGDISHIERVRQIIEKSPYKNLPFYNTGPQELQETLKNLPVVPPHCLLIWCVCDALPLTTIIAQLPSASKYAKGIGYHFAGSESIIGSTGSKSAGFSLSTHL